MPTFKFDDTIEPVIVELGDESYRAMPAIPATMLDEFMDLFARIPPLVDRLTRKTPAEAAAESGNVIEATVVGDDSPPPSESAEVEVANTDANDKLAAYREFIEVSLLGLEMVILPGADNYDLLKERLSSRERPVRPVLLAEMFGTLAAYYMGGGKDSKEGKEKLGEGPSGDASESSPSSDTTGGSSEANSSAAPAEPNSTDGTTTT